MELLRVHNLSIRLGDKDLLSEVSFTLNQGQKLGLVGRNGVGKSTLLEILAGKRRADEGRVQRMPGVRVTHLGQEGKELEQGTVRQAGEQALGYLRSLESALRKEEKRLSAGEDRLAQYGELVELFEGAGGYQAEARLERGLAALGFGPESYRRQVNTLSGGERARLALALALAAQADVLLLDEPSNHLDIAMRRWLSETLAGYAGAVILASHDRALLDGVTTHTAHLENGKLQIYKGGYSSVHERRAQHRRAQRKKETERHKTLARLTESRDKVGVAQRVALDRRIAQLERETVQPPTAGKVHDLTITTERARGTLLHAQHLGKRFADRTIIDDVSLRIGAGDKIALLGPNGTGKSTLLELIAGEIESDNPKTQLEWGKDARLAVFDQEGRGLSDQPLFAQLSRLVSEPRARMLLALVGISQAAWTGAPANLSGGERARAGIALIMAGEATLLLLDEPTEGLDITTIERLEDALRDTEAAFILVSHDQALVEHVAERVWTLEDGELREFRGGLHGYYSGNLRLSVDPDELRTREQRLVAAEETSEARLERLELERLELDRRLGDPFLLSERESERLRRRYRELLDELAVLYDAGLPPPQPSYSARHGPVEVTAEAGVGHSYSFDSNTGLRARLLIPGDERIGHLVLLEPDGGCVLSWAYARAVRTVARLAFEHLDVRVLQAQSPHDLHPCGFHEAGAGWWLLRRDAYESAEGYRQTKPHRKLKRLYFHPDWEDWVAFRRWRKQG